MRLNFLSLLVLVLLLNACKKDPPKPAFDVPDSSFGLIYTEILEVSCNVSTCHDGISVHPRLTGENTYEAMVTSHVHDPEALEAGLHLVKPFDPDSSFLYQKMIFDSSEFAFGSPMPQGGLTVTAGQIEFIRRWIAAGAPEQGHVADRSLLN